MKRHLSLYANRHVVLPGFHSIFSAGELFEHGVKLCNSLSLDKTDFSTEMAIYFFIKETIVNVFIDPHWKRHACNVRLQMSTVSNVSCI